MSENRRRRNNGAQNRQVKKARTNNARRILLLVGLMSLVAVISIGGTIAWLTASSDQVVNTFTPSDINITLTESDADKDGKTLENSYKMVPGGTITKDPKVSVEANSEACWLFVELEKSTNFDKFMTYTIATGWTAVTGVDNVYYREISATSTTATAPMDILSNNQVEVRDTVTKADMNGLTGATYPTLTVKAYAVQKEAASTAEEAWALLPTTTSTTP